MFLLITVIALKLAMLMAIGADPVLAMSIAVPEGLLGAAIGLWLTKRQFVPPTILSQTLKPGIALVRRVQGRLVIAAASIVISCALWLKKAIGTIWFVLI